MSEGFRVQCFCVTAEGAFYHVVKAMCKLTNEDFNYQIFMGCRLSRGGFLGLVAVISNRSWTVDRIASP